MHGYIKSEGEIDARMNTKVKMMLLKRESERVHLLPLTGMGNQRRHAECLSSCSTAMQWDSSGMTGYM
jgi:hypothetical protein